MIRGWQYVLSGVLHENQPVNTSVFQVKAIDVDPGPKGDLTFSITPYSGRFIPRMLPELRNLLKIHPKTGLVTSAKTLDFDSLVPRPHHACVEGTYLITATDHGIPPKSATAFLHLCYLDVNDNTPQFADSLQKSIIVNETMPVGSDIFRVMATDVDQGSNGAVSYLLEEDEVSALSSTDTFAINPTTGVVRLIRPLHVDKNEYVLRVIARDGGRPPEENVTKVYVMVAPDRTHQTSTPMRVNATKVQPVKAIPTTSNMSNIFLNSTAKRWLMQLQYLYRQSMFQLQDL